MVAWPLASKENSSATTLNLSAVDADHAVWFLKLDSVSDPGQIGMGAAIESHEMEAASSQYIGEPALAVDETLKICTAIKCVPTGNVHVVVHTVAGAAGVRFKEGRLQVPFRGTGPGASLRYLFTSGSDRALNVPLSFSVVQDTGGRLIARLVDAGGTPHDITLELEDVGTWTAEHLLRVAWGPRRGFRLWLDGVKYEPATPYYGGWFAAQGSVIRVGADHGGTVAWGTVGYRPGSVEVGSRDLPDWLHEAAMVDPWAPMREAVAGLRTVGFTTHYPKIEAGGETGKVNLSALTATTVAAEVRLRYRAGTSWAAAAVATPVELDAIPAGRTNHRVEAALTGVPLGDTLYVFWEAYAGEDPLPEARWVALQQPLCRCPMRRVRKANIADPHTGNEHGYWPARGETLVGTAASRRHAAVCDAILIQDEPYDLLTHHGDDAMGQSGVEDWETYSETMLAKAAYVVNEVALLYGLVPTAFCSGNWDGLKGLDRVNGGAQLMQALVVWALLFAAGWGDDAVAHAEPTLRNELSYWPDIDDVDAEETLWDSWVRSYYIVPGGEDGDVTLGNLSASGAVVTMDGGHTIEAADVVDLVVKGSSGCVSRDGMTATVVDGNTVTLSGGTGDDLTGVVGSGPFEVRAHRRSNPARLLWRDRGLQVCGFSEMPDDDGRLHFDAFLESNLHSHMADEVIGTGCGTADGTAWSWGPQTALVSAWLAASESATRELHAHAFQFSGQYQRGPGTKWEEQNADGLAMQTLARDEEVACICGHDHNGACNRRSGLWNVRCPSTAGHLAPPAEYGDVETFGADVAGDGMLYTAHVLGYVDESLGERITSACVQAAFVGNTVPAVVSERGMWGRVPVSFDSEQDVVTVDEGVNRLVYAVPESVFAANGGLDGWPDNLATILASNVSLDSGDSQWEPGLSGDSVETGHADTELMWVCFTPRRVCVVVLAYGAGAGTGSGSGSGLGCHQDESMALTDA